MIGKILRQNRVFFVMMITVAIFFAVVLYFGASRIYGRESQWRHEIASLELGFGQTTIQSFFGNLKHHLFFIQNSDSVKNLISSNFKSPAYLNEVQNLFYNLAKTSDEIDQIRIIDADGMQIVRIDRAFDQTPIIVKDKQLKTKNGLDFIQKVKDHEGGIYVSLTDFKIDSSSPKKRSEAFIQISSPLLDSQNHRNGLLTLTISVSKLLKLLPKSMF